MDRGHEKHSSSHMVRAVFLCILEISYLDDHRQRLDDKYAADKDKEDLLLEKKCHKADYSAQGKASGVSHEHFCRMTVEPEESYGCPYDGQAQHCKLTAS